MKSRLTEYLNHLMLPIPGGVETVRDYRDEQKWISSNSKMSMPGQKGKLTEIEKRVEIKAFLMAKYPVTEGLYQEILSRTGETAKKMLEVGAKANNMPVMKVSWYEAVSFCNRLSKACGLQECYAIDKHSGHVGFEPQANGYRLPTDAEWQYACKATSEGYRYGEITDIAWYKDNAEEQVHEAGKKQPNEWGLYDMLGNVWEWCWDLYDEKTYGEYRVFRGGSWAEEARGCGATSRRRGHPTFKIDDLGFRLARSWE
ncbi:formylglycine-generating enzyme family protein [Anoxynatronum sibiricum]|uniref:Formylglycine-generating enzyme family protein n=1 Tax=Anoxynatronum sibiricum TaxID=210623 RepID=A0ABU9VT58_9CLOT